MRFVNVIVVPVLAMAVKYAVAECVLKNQIEGDAEREDDDRACEPRDDGIWTFTMGMRSVGVPIFDGGNTLAGNMYTKWFTVYDEDCNPKGFFSPSQDGDCGTPYAIHMDDLPYSIMVKEVNFLPGAGNFKFTYADGAFMIGENGCKCRDTSSGLEGSELCRCEFPSEGDAGDWEGAD
jgi:hypothetical protein